MRWPRAPCTWVIISMEPANLFSSSSRPDSRRSTGPGTTSISSKATTKALPSVPEMASLDCGWTETYTKAGHNLVARMETSRWHREKISWWKRWNVGHSYRTQPCTPCPRLRPRRSLIWLEFRESLAWRLIVPREKLSHGGQLSRFPRDIFPEEIKVD